MTEPKATLRAPAETLRDMLAECPTWRALCLVPDGETAPPARTWAEVAAIVDDGLAVPGTAADRIVFGAFVDQLGLPNPKAMIRQDPSRYRRDGGFSRDGSLYLLVHLDTPAAFADDPSAAILDAERKAYSLEEDLVGLVRQAGRLDVLAVEAFQPGLCDPKKHNGRKFQILEYVVEHRGGGY